VVVVRRALPFPIGAVFAAWLDPKGMREWMSPSGPADVTLDPRVGGEFQIRMLHGDPPTDHFGRFLEIQPPALLRFIWRSVNTNGRDTLVTVRLTALSDSRTELELTHEDLPEEQMKSHSGGWSAIIARLEGELSR
jgi:uncharacterized protein YndB with AHSA1/START domain